ncbi:MAG: isoprenyl transferase [Chthoniobacteraceae bacterium]
MKPPPRHIAIIMDGNGRWARERGLPRIKGHEAGATSLRQVVEGCAERKVEFLTVYAFSTENWNRPPEEISALMGLLEHFIEQETPELIEKGIRLQAIGRITDLPESCQAKLHSAIEATAQGTALTLILALSYSGRVEIADAVKSIVRDVQAGQIDCGMIDPGLISRYLYTRVYPDPELLIRTSGEMRLSNFLLWQLSYTEIVVTQKLWPDFGKDDLQAAIEEFHGRNRRFGAV